MRTDPLPRGRLFRAPLMRTNTPATFEAQRAGDPVDRAEIQRVFGIPTAIAVLFVSALAARLALLLMIGGDASASRTPDDLLVTHDLAATGQIVLAGALLVPAIYALVRAAGDAERVEATHVVGIAAAVLATLWPASLLDILHHDSATWGALIVVLFAVGCVRLLATGGVGAAMLAGGSLATALWFLPITLVFCLTALAAIAAVYSPRGRSVRLVYLLLATVPVCVLTRFMVGTVDEAVLPAWLSGRWSIDAVRQWLSVWHTEQVIAQQDWLGTLEVSGISIFAMAVLIGIGRARRREWSTLIPVVMMALLLLHVTDGTCIAALQVMGFVFAGLTASLAVAQRLVPVIRPPMVEAFLGHRRANDGRESA